jgi:beta-galactosidase/beta-glucuronidase
MSYKDASRIARDFTILTPPINTFNFAVDKEKKGEAQGWQQPGFDDKAWKKTDVATDTWYALGLEGYYGPSWYRTTVKVPDLPAGKKVYLWVGTTDGACKVFVNGKPAQYVKATGEKADEANGFCEPFSFDITDAVKSNAGNQISILATRNFLNELGTGGLMGPVVLYREK